MKLNQIAMNCVGKGWLGAVLIGWGLGCQPVMEPAAPSATPPTPLDQVAPSAPTVVAALTKSGMASVLSQELILVHVWAPWERGSADTTAALTERSGAWQAGGLAVLGVMVDEGKEPVPAEDVGFPVVKANPDLLNALGGIRALPTRLIMDNQGKILARFSGFVPLDDIELEIKRLTTTVSD